MKKKKATTQDKKKEPLKVIVVNPLTKEQEKKMVQSVSEMLRIKYYS